MADEKYISKIKLPDGDTYTLKDRHTHAISIAESAGTTQLALIKNTRYVITAGGSSFIFTTPEDKDTTYTAGTYYKKYTNLNNTYAVKVIKVQ